MFSFRNDLTAILRPNADWDFWKLTSFSSVKLNIWRYLDFFPYPIFISSFLITIPYQTVERCTILFLAGEPPVGQDLFFIEALRSHLVRHITLGRTPLHEWSARRREFCLTEYNTQERETPVSMEGFVLATPASKRPQTHASDRVAIGI
jgi:hypothetical protein